MPLPTTFSDVSRVGLRKEKNPVGDTAENESSTEAGGEDDRAGDRGPGAEGASAGYCRSVTGSRVGGWGMMGTAQSLITCRRDCRCPPGEAWGM